MEHIRKALPSTVLPFVIILAAAAAALSSCDGSDVGIAQAATGEGQRGKDAERRIRATLRGFREVPATSTCARGTFSAVVKDGTTIEFELSYADLEGDVQQAHIHFGQKSVNGGIALFLCTNLGNGPAGTQACPPPPATVTGTLQAGDVVGPAVQGISPGELDEVLRAIRKGVSYVNVHSAKFPGGEIRGQVRNVDDRHGNERGHDGKDDDQVEECVPDQSGP